MPHKRAKRSTREQHRQERGYNHTPETQSLSDEAIPKSVARVINAAKIREQWKIKKRELEEREDRDRSKRQKIHRRQEDNSTTMHQLRIQPGESIQHFNRRVEDNIQPVLRTAIQAARAIIRRNPREEMKDRHNVKKVSKPSDSSASRQKASTSASSDMTSEQVSIPPKDFPKFSAGAPKRLNDVAQAPPALTTFPRLVKHLRRTGAHASTGDSSDSPAQRLAMDKERSAVIRRYRQLKEWKRKGPFVAEGVGDGAT